MWNLSHKSSGDPAWRLAEVVKISRSGYLSVPLGKGWEVGAERRISVFFDFGTIVILITGLFCGAVNVTLRLKHGYRL